MSKPTNSAARNNMSEFERQCYDLGWEAAEERIIKLLDENWTEPMDWLTVKALIKGEAE